MKEPVDRHEIWDRLYNRLSDEFTKRNPKNAEYARMFIAIILSAGESRDMTYIDGIGLLTHCQLLGFKTEYMKQLLQLSWKTIDEEKAIKKAFLNNKNN